MTILLLIVLPKAFSQNEEDEWRHSGTIGIGFSSSLGTEQDYSDLCSIASYASRSPVCAITTGAARDLYGSDLHGGTISIGYFGDMNNGFTIGFKTSSISAEYAEDTVRDSRIFKHTESFKFLIGGNYEGYRFYFVKGVNKYRFVGEGFSGILGEYNFKYDISGIGITIPIAFIPFSSDKREDGELTYHIEFIMNDSLSSDSYLYQSLTYEFE